MILVFIILVIIILCIILYLLRRASKVREGDSEKKYYFIPTCCRILKGSLLADALTLSSSLNCLSRLTPLISNVRFPPAISVNPSAHLSQSTWTPWVCLVTATLRKSSAAFQINQLHTTERPQMTSHLPQWSTAQCHRHRKMERMVQHHMHFIQYPIVKTANRVAKWFLQTDFSHTGNFYPSRTKLLMLLNDVICIKMLRI